eukprot:Hpha_TRINITY_DN34737_c0_g1::TRINITY_DN34737_c0_g1_i1::g.177925::m.177925
MTISSPRATLLLLFAAAAAAPSPLATQDAAARGSIHGGSAGFASRLRRRVRTGFYERNTRDRRSGKVLYEMMSTAVVNSSLSRLQGQTVGDVRIQACMAGMELPDGIPARCYGEGAMEGLEEGWKETFREAVAEALDIDESRVQRLVVFEGSVVTTFTITCEEKHYCSPQQGGGFCVNAKCQLEPMEGRDNGTIPSAVMGTAAPFTPAKPPSGPPPDRPSSGVEWRIRSATLTDPVQGWIGGQCCDGREDTGCASAPRRTPWFQIDLGYPLPVGQVTVVNPPGGCGQRLVCGEVCGDTTCHPNPGVEIRVGDQQCFNFSGDCTSNPVVGLHTENALEMRHVHINIENGTRGRFVVLRFPGGRRQVHLQEVTVRAPPEMPAEMGMTTYGEDYVSDMDASYVQQMNDPEGGNTARLRPPDQSSTNDMSLVLLIVFAGLVALTGVVAIVLWCRDKHGEESTWFVRTTLFAQGLVKIYDWLTDVMFFIYVSALPDLGEVNNYSVVAMVILVFNFGVECCKIGWVVNGACSGKEPFVWVGMTHVLVLQLPAAIKVPVREVRGNSYAQQMRDRWAWLMHLTEDVPEISLTLVYMINRDTGLTSVASFSISMGSLLFSACIKVWRKVKRDRKLRKVMREEEEDRQARMAIEIAGRKVSLAYPPGGPLPYKPSEPIQ